ncbi:MAG: TIGR02921 family PEP-CTERM protein, partial [Cyanobacteria bacterium P01_A01_bin.135]
MNLARFKFRSLFAVFFWLFNLSLLLIVTVYFVTPFGTAMIVDGLRGLVPLSLLVPVFGLVGVPTTSLLMGRWHQRQLKSQDLQSEEPEPVRSEPATTLTLFQIFFGLEAPLLMACTIRLFFLRDLTSVSALVFTSIALGTVVTGRWLSQRRSGSGWISLTGITLMLALSLYISAIALFYAPPIFLIAAVILYHSLYIVVALPILFPFIMLFTGLVIAPWGMVLLFFKTWRGLWRRAVRWSRRLSGGLLALWLVALLLLQQQPQAKAFALLTSPTQSESDHPALLQQSEVIRKGLLNAYLGAYRYPLLNNSDMFNLYSGLLGFSDAAAEVVQGAYNALLSPFAYRGSASDKAEAARLYAEFFDTPILRGEHQAIQKAVLSNFNRTQAKAGLLDIGAERVRLQRQEVTVTPQGDWAEVELHEVYANTTGEDTEILYYFSLPETATVTGLWLGETGDRKLYNPVVATRGAAQQVYNDQVQRRVDPALLEQVGPRNYRLRAFPIPPVGQDLLPEDGQDDRMHLWLTYRVIQQDGQWPLPSLSEQRNVFWDQGTERVINGEGQQESEAWLPASIPIADAGRSPKTVQVALPAGHIVAQPLQSADYQLPSSRRFAVILDTSYSMGEHRQAVAANVQWLEDNLLASNEADFYITSAGDIQARKVDSPDALKEAVFYGAMQTRQMLEQYLAAAGSADYDAILLLTDAGSYELTEDSTPLPLTAPL